MIGYKGGLDGDHLIYTHFLFKNKNREDKKLRNKDGGREEGKGLKPKLGNRSPI